MLMYKPPPPKKMIIIKHKITFINIIFTQHHPEIELHGECDLVLKDLDTILVLLFINFYV